MNTEHQFISRSTIIQRYSIRLMHDSRLVEKLYSGAIIEDFGFPLSKSELEILKNVDQRRWLIDSERSHRALEALLSQSAVSAWAFLDLRKTSLEEFEAGDWLLSFFHSHNFHGCIMNRGYLIDAFFAWMSTELEAFNPEHQLSNYKNHVRDLINLERSIARTKRAVRPKIELSSPSFSLQDSLLLPPWLTLIKLSSGLSTSYLNIHQAVQDFRDLGGVATLLNQEFPRELLPTIVDNEWVLIELDWGNKISVEALSEGLAEVLLLAQDQSPVSSLRALLIEAEVDPPEVDDMIHDWVTEGLILIKS